MAGTQYPNCVRGTAVDALYRDFRVIVVSDACSAQTPEVAEANIRDMRGMGIVCEPLDRLRNCWPAGIGQRKSDGDPAAVA